MTKTYESGLLKYTPDSLSFQMFLPDDCLFTGLRWLAIFRANRQRLPCVTAAWQNSALHWKKGESFLEAL
jgi:hypothetical protein